MANNSLSQEVKTTRHKLGQIVQKWAEAAQEWLQGGSLDKIDQVIIARYMLWVYGKQGKETTLRVPYSVKLKALDRIAEMRGLLQPQEREGDYEKLLKSLLKRPEPLSPEDQLLNLPNNSLPRV